VWVIAHRGASGFAPENTLAAFRKAVELGAGFIETDLQLSRDARLVALHDDTLERTTNGRGAVSATTLEELRRLDAGSWFRRSSNKESAPDFTGERIPTIEEVLAFGREHEIGLHLEIKATGPSGAEHAIVGALHAAGEVPRSVVLSFDQTTLKRVRQLEPLAVTGFLFSDRLPAAVATAVNVGARQLLPRMDRVTPELIKDAHAHDLKLVAWTVNAPERMQELISAGVDGIITDYPDRLLEVLRTSEQANSKNQR
jgi:glycerophosphoryl diester phosphodiesterase